jgi:hypothetical protein
VKKILLALFVAVSIIAQEDSAIENKYVTGILSTSDGVYLILEDGFLRINEIDPYEEYYRMIYNDSTIVNPNTIISGDFEWNVIPFLVNSHTRRRINLEDPLLVGALIQINEQNQTFLSTYAQNLIDSLNSN